MVCADQGSSFFIKRRKLAVAEMQRGEMSYTDQPLPTPEPFTPGSDMSKKLPNVVANELR
jgi:hypothetical protein